MAFHGSWWDQPYCRSQQQVGGGLLVTHKRMNHQGVLLIQSSCWWSIISMAKVPLQQSSIWFLIIMIRNMVSHQRKNLHFVFQSILLTTNGMISTFRRNDQTIIISSWLVMVNSHQKQIKSSCVFFQINTYPYLLMFDRNGWFVINSGQKWCDNWQQEVNKGNGLEPSVALVVMSCHVPCDVSLYFLEPRWELIGCLAHSL